MPNVQKSYPQANPSKAAAKAATVSISNLLAKQTPAAPLHTARV